MPSPSTRETGIDTAETGTVEVSEVDLVVPEAWSSLVPAMDPVPEHQPSDIDCSPDSIREETGALEMQTDTCNYVLIDQPTRADIQVGDTLDLLVYHSALSATEPAEAHVLITLGGETLWEQTVAIPSSSAVYPTTTVASTAAAAGTPVVIHLHNHGGNSWKLAHLRRSR